MATAGPGAASLRTLALLLALAAAEVDAAVVSRPIGAFVVTADDSSGAWSVAPRTAPGPVMRGAGTCVPGPDGNLPALRLGRGTPAAKQSFGNYRIDLDPPGPSTMTWSDVCGAASSITTPPGRLVISWSTAAGIARLTFRSDGLPHPDDLRIEVTSSAPVDAAELAWSAEPGESFFGLGTQSFAMDLRGGTFPLWTQEQGIGKPPDGGFFPLQNYPEAAYAPMGILHSSRGYAAVLGTDAFAEIDLAESDPGRVTLRSYRELPALVLVAGGSARTRLASLTERTGRLARPPRWVYAPWNDAVGGPLRLLQVVAKLRDRGIPSSAIWSEDWAGGEEGPFGFRLSYAWEWDPGTYPDLPADVAALHELGFSFLVYFNPFVPQTTRMWQEGVAGGFLVKDATGGPYVLTEPGFRPSGLVDLTNTAAVAWLSGYLDTAADGLGIDGWMADFAEWLPYDGVLASGEDPWIAHNRYPLLWQSVNRDALAAAHPGSDDWTFFVRSGWASTRGASAGRAPLMWGGDQNTDWGLDDGFPTVLPIAAHAGLSGIALFGSDIAGYSAFITPPTTKELFFRWASHAAFHPLMRTHHGSSQSANWSFDRDEETLQHYRRLAVVHTLLLPYLELLEEEAIGAGLPMSRHPWLVEPARPGLWQGSGYEIFLGDDVLLAPVLVEGATSRTVRLPTHDWWPMWGTGPLGAGFPGPGSTWQVQVAAPLEAIPAFVRPGTILPLLGDVVDSFRDAADPSVRDLDDVAGSYRLALYPDVGGSARPRRVGTATVSAQLLPAGLDWRSAVVDGAPVKSCDASPAPPCATRELLRIEGATISVVIGGGRLDVAGAVSQSYVVGIGRAAWVPFELPETPPLP